jgi:hypothetical protein
VAVMSRSVVDRPSDVAPDVFSRSSQPSETRLAMGNGKSKQRAIGILLVLGSILVLFATWDLAEMANSSPQSAVRR